MEVDPTHRTEKFVRGGQSPAQFLEVALAEQVQRATSRDSSRSRPGREDFRA